MGRRYILFAEKINMKKRKITFEEYLKIHNFKEILMDSELYEWTWDRTYRIRKIFKEEYYKKYGYTKFNRFEIMDI